MCNIHFICLESEQLIKCDMVMLAMGFLGPEKKIVDELKTKLDPRGNLETPRSKYSTSVPQVYAAGGKLSKGFLNSDLGFFSIFTVRYMYLFFVCFLCPCISRRHVVFLSCPSVVNFNYKRFIQQKEIYLS